MTDDLMYNERDRIDSFVNWPVTHKTPRDMAAAGLFYVRHRDIVECAFCGVQIAGWELEDVPIVEHQKWSPNCPFLKGEAFENIPLTENEFTDSFVVQEHRNSCCNELSSWFHSSVSIKHEKYPTYASKENRIKSFKHWPVGLYQKPAELAEAGFFYTGRGDETVCFHCGKGLKNWEADENPWLEHANKSPDCFFLRLKKDAEFIKMAQGNIIYPLKSVRQNYAKCFPRNTEKYDEEELDSSKCKICLVKNPSVIFPPCKHLMSCADCAENLKIWFETAIVKKRDKFASYALKVKREETFKLWPAKIRQRPNELVDGGFFYTGIGDETVCFHCGQMCKNWKSKDDIWLRHAEKSPNCAVVLLKKNEENKNILEKKKMCAAEKKKAKYPEEKDNCNFDDLCKICLDQKPSVIFLPCKHLVVCGDCSMNFENCPICRKKIVFFFNVYRS